MRRLPRSVTSSRRILAAVSISFPPVTRRQELLAIDWVEEATVSKIWPNTVKVRIEERRPVAFIHLPANRKTGLSEFALIDKDGFILRPKMAAKFTLPVIDGIRESEDRDDRRARVQRVLAMLACSRPSGGPYFGGGCSRSEQSGCGGAHRQSRAEPDDGRRKLFLAHVEFLNNYNEIKTKRPDATTFDLRVDNVITVVGDQKNVK